MSAETTVSNDRCDICIEEECKGTYACHCETCDKRDCCVKVLRPTIRVTTRCTQTCGHCCFECSPKRNEMMTPDVARAVRRFLDSNGIIIVSLMGGEVFCNPDWREVVDILARDMGYVRLVTNGDWIGTDFLDHLRPYRDFMKLSISQDRWHTNAHVEEAVAACEAGGFMHSLATDEETTADSVVPIGRGEFHYGFYNTFGCFCRKPDHRYNFLIDEGGEIYKCGLGAWNYADIFEYEEGGFAPRFKEFNQVFWRTFIGNCAQCVRSSKRAALEARKGS